MASEQDPDSGQRGGKGRVIALVFVLLLAAFAVWLVNRIMADVKLQNCVLSGRRDCAPIEPDGGR